MTTRIVTDANGRKHITNEPLLHSPPAATQHERTWVGLTDEEVIKMSRYDLEYAALIGEVQRKLKERNT